MIVNLKDKDLKDKIKNVRAGKLEKLLDFLIKLRAHSNLFKAR